MEIRLAKLEEFEAVMQFYYNLIDSMQEQEFKPGWQKDVYPARESVYHALLDNELYVSEEDNIIFGAVTVNHDFAEGYETVSWQVEAGKDEIYVIHALGIAASCQGQGLAKKMVEFTIEMGRDKGIKAIRLDVLADNKPAHRLYLAAGFEYIDTIQLYYEDTGLTDFLLYELIL